MAKRITDTFPWAALGAILFSGIPLITGRLASNAGQARIDSGSVLEVRLDPQSEWLVYAAAPEPERVELFSLRLEGGGPLHSPLGCQWSIDSTNADGSATSSADFTVTRPPAIVSFTPASGPVDTPVTITGIYFTGCTSVSFNGAPAAFTVVSSTQIDAAVPARATSGKISVTNGDGSGTSSADFTILQPPVIRSFTPATGPVGMPVKLSGSGFAGAMSVWFNGTQTLLFTVLDDATLLTTVPLGTTSGKISISAPGGKGASADDFVVLQPPAIGSFTPPHGTVGTAVTIRGPSLDGTTRVAFNGTTAAFRVVSSTQIDTMVPIGASSGELRVTTPAGTATSSSSFAVGDCPSDVAIELWPPNHKYIEIDLAALLGPATGAIEVQAITQDEPPTETGEDDTSCDALGMGASVVHVRAERSGHSNGRVYRIQYSALGGACSGSVTVSVPHDQGHPAVDDGQRWDATGDCD